MKRQRSEREYRELLYAQITSAVYNTGFRATDKPTSPLDFMPSQWTKQPSAAKSNPAPRTRMTKKRRQAIWVTLRAQLAPMARKG